MAFPPLGNSYYVVSVSVDFLSNSKWDASFHPIAYDYSRVDWDSRCDHLRDIPWKDIFKLFASAASEFCEWVLVEIDYISLTLLVPVSLISMAFSCLCCCHSLEKLLLFVTT